MRRLLIGNRRYSSWSLRGWLALKHSGLPFKTELLMFDTPAFTAAKAGGRLPAGRVPVLWDAAGEVCVWDSLAILERCAEQPGVPAYWPESPRARSFARSMVAEMHGGFAALRAECPMDLGARHATPFVLSPAARADWGRVDALWTDAHTRFGADGPYLFGAFGAADIMYAPVATRALSYAVPLGPEATDYAHALADHPWMLEWADAAASEPKIAEHRL